MSGESDADDLGSGWLGERTARVRANLRNVRHWAGLSSAGEDDGDGPSTSAQAKDLLHPDHRETVYIPRYGGGWEGVLEGFSVTAKHHVEPMERWAVSSTVSASFLIGLVGGAALSLEESVERFKAHNVSTAFISKSDAQRRYVDYVYLRIIKRGTVQGVKLAAFTGTLVAALCGATLFADHFSLAFVPMSGFAAGAVCRFNYGLRGMGVAGALAGLGATVALVPALGLGHLYYGESLDAVYRRLRREAFIDAFLTKQHRRLVSLACDEQDMMVRASGQRFLEEAIGGVPLKAALRLHYRFVDLHRDDDGETKA